jgi:hypothetical protein
MPMARGATQKGEARQGKEIKQVHLGLGLRDGGIECHVRCQPVAAAGVGGRRGVMGGYMD